MSTFAPTPIEYYETRADGGYVWDVRYDLGFTGNQVNVDLDIHFTGGDPGPVLATWQQGISDLWGQRFFLSDGHRLYPLSIEGHFVDSGEDQSVFVTAGEGRGNMLHWYTTPAGWGPDYADELAAHEFGHMLGAFDEYSGGATLDGYTTTGTLMADFGTAGFKNFTTYVDGIVGRTEEHSGLALEAQLSRAGSDVLGDTMTGTAAMDGFYGFGGRDSISGARGNDYLDGGSGADTLVGGAGHDILLGGLGADRFVFDVAAASSSDSVRTFDPAHDVLQFEKSAFSAAGARGTLDHARFFEGAGVDATGAADAGQRFLYDTTSGKLWYDPDGSDPAAKLLVATLAGHPDITLSDLRVI